MSIFCMATFSTGKPCTCKGLCDCGLDMPFHSFSFTFRWWRWRVTTGGWGFTPTKMMAVSTGLTTLFSIMFPGPSGGRTHSAVIASVSTSLPPKVRTARTRNLRGPKFKCSTHTSACICHPQTADWADQKCHSDLPYICKRVNVTGTIPPTPSYPHPPAGCPDGWSSYQHKVKLQHTRSCIKDV